MSPGQIVAAVAAPAIAAVAVWRRGALGRERLVLVLGIALVVAVYASGVLARLPDLQPLLAQLAQTLGRWTYLLVGALAFLETGAFVGFLVPGEFTVILGGVVAGEGQISIVLLVVIVWLSTFLGDTASFVLGRKLGRGFVVRHGPRFRITERRLAEVEDYLDRYGAPTIVVGRFASFLRTLAPFVVGSTRLPYRRFLPYSVIGTGLWGATFSLLGFFFWRSFAIVAEIAAEATLVFGVVILVAATGLYLHRRSTTRRAAPRSSPDSE